MPVTVTSRSGTASSSRYIEVYRLPDNALVSKHVVETDAFESAVTDAEARGGDGDYEIRFPSKMVIVRRSDIVSTEPGGGVLPPSIGISSVNNNVSPYANQTSVNIVGFGFGASKGTGTVTYFDQPLSVLSWSDTVITVAWVDMPFDVIWANSPVPSTYQLKITNSSAQTTGVDVTTVAAPNVFYGVIASTGATNSIYSDDAGAGIQLGADKAYVRTRTGTLTGFDVTTGVISSRSDPCTIEYSIWDESAGRWGNIDLEYFYTPSPPSIVSVAQTSVTLGLPVSPSANHVSWTVQRSTDNLNFSNRQTGVTASTWTDTGLNSNATYYYRIIGVENTGKTNGPSASVPATTGTTVSLASLRAAGYFIATDYAGVDPTGTTDSWQGLQNAAIAAINARKPLWLPSGTYLVSDTLRFYGFSRNQGNYDMAGALVGATYPSRPVIKVAPSTNKFDSAFSGNAGYSRRPVVHFEFYVPTTGTNVAPPADRNAWHPYAGSFTSGGLVWEPQANIMFCAHMWNVNIDTSGKDGADGLAASLAQRCTFGKIKVTATGSNVGIVGGSGRATPCVDVEVVGGRYGISTQLVEANQVPKGTSYSGVKLSGQTTAAFYTQEAGVMTVVGLDATLNNIPLIVYAGSTTQSSSGSAVFVDGKITCTNYGGSTWVFDNTLQKTTYIRNIYVTGTNNLLRTSSTQVTGSGTWKLINEVCVNDLRGVEYPASVDETNLAVKSLINGVVSRTLVPVSSVSSSVTAPTVDYVARHVCNPESIDSGPYVDLTSYFATYGGDNTATADCAAAFDAAIAAAEAAGHNRVLIPAGRFGISRTIVLRQNTKLFGIHFDNDFTWAAWVNSRIVALDSWVATSRQYMLQTPDSATATCRLDWIGTETNSGTDADYNLWGINWRAGKNSGSIGTVIKQEYEASSTRPPRALWHFTGNGGGKHYGFETNGSQVRSGGWFLLMEGTSQPALFYGNQVEVTKNAPVADSNIKLSGCSNVRFYATKREGIAPTIKIENSSNIAWYGASSMRGPAPLAYHYISGNSSNILTALVMVERAVDPVNASKYTLQENITAGNRGILWPENVALQKLGTINDSAVFSDTSVEVTYPVFPFAVPSIFDNDTGITNINARYGIISQTTLGGRFEFFDGGAFTYTRGSQTGIASFTYRVYDYDNAGSNYTATVRITVS